MKNILQASIVVMSLLIPSQSIVAQIQNPLLVSKESDIDISNYTGIVTEQYSNGSPWYWKTLVDGKADGLWLEWYPNGRLRYRAYWKNNLGNGRWEYFYPNGQLRSVSFYIDDITQGIYQGYHANGQLQVDATYVNGKKDGVEMSYDINGLIISRKRYENGIQVIDEPMVFDAGNISGTNSNEWGINFVPDGKTAYFTRRDITSGKKRIYVTSNDNGRWSKPVIAPFSVDEDEAPYISADGTKLYFASYRPLPDGSTTQPMDMNIWVIDRDVQDWSQPKPISGTINKTIMKGDEWPKGYEAGPFTDKAGNLYYWTKGSKSKATNLYISMIETDGRFQEPKELIEPSSDKYYDTAAHLSPDGNIMVFASDDRPGGYGGSDIYYSKKIDGQWSAPKNMGPVVNSYRSDGFPSFSPDGKYFYFSSSRAGRKDINGDYISDLYYMESKYLMIK